MLLNTIRNNPKRPKGAPYLIKYGYHSEQGDRNPQVQDADQAAGTAAQEAEAAERACRETGAGRAEEVEKHHRRRREEEAGGGPQTDQGGAQAAGGGAQATEGGSEAPEGYERDAGAEGTETPQEREGKGETRQEGWGAQDSQRSPDTSTVQEGPEGYGYEVRHNHSPDIRTGQLPQEG